MRESGEKFGSIRYKLLRTIQQTLRDSPSEERLMTIESAVAMPPREQEELVDLIKDNVEEDEVPAIPFEMALTPDEDEARGMLVVDLDGHPHKMIRPRKCKKCRNKWMI